jgi:hypothetical protein
MVAKSRRLPRRRDDRDLTAEEKAVRQRLQTFSASEQAFLFGATAVLTAHGRERLRDLCLVVLQELAVRGD